jgi:Fur family transcriptional regulator, peroxide stress response regulator
MESFERIFREHGLPLTVQRRVILDSMLDRTDHPSAERVYSEVQAKIPGISRASVYRILDLFVELGLIQKINPPGMAARFDPTVRRHTHLVCRSCGRMVDMDAPGIGVLPLPDGRAYGFQIDDYQINFSGLCADCAKKHTQQPDK